MIREANRDDLKDILELYLDLHETEIPEDSEHLSDTWEQIINDENHHLSVEIDSQTLQKMTDKTKDNIWFEYFIKSFNKNVGWIDFEKEVAYVISCFDSFFRNADVCFMPGRSCKKEGNRYIIMKVFNFFIDENTNASHLHE